MASVKRFEELFCWQKARLLTKEVYKIFKDLKFKDYGLQDQIQRASVSVMSNIAEGFESGTRQEFINYLYIAKGSAGEVRAQLYVAYDAGYLNLDTFKRLNSLAEDCSVLISRFIKSLKSSNFQGLQYKKEKSRAELDREEFDAWLKQNIEDERKKKEQQPRFKSLNV